MLKIQNISKTYKTGELVQKALDSVTLNLRDNEFVAVLGPSGSGKTTLLNIIGGLDRYDSGDLIINNVSTKKYKDRDWDSYRNHTIGFVFQSYNLIPHQTVLQNVELALTISGISKKERTRRSYEALEKVGLKGQEHKKPNQMSGGQMQRVAIARALVNNPSVVLADEPTGALDTKTSIQIMELLKEVAKDRLVVMVTHNPDLANEYANRIVNLRDGQIISDTNPFNSEDFEAVDRKMKRTSMSLFTSFTLSLKNLMTKKTRTFLTSFAGSIGIIGIALILSLSQGFQNYIDKIQEDTMTSYPLTIQSETANIFSALLGLKAEGEGSDVEGEVKEVQMVASMMNSVGSNDLKGFKKYIEEHNIEIDNYVSNVSYSYSVSPLIYTIDTSNNLTQLNPNTLFTQFYSDSSASLLSSLSSSNSIGTFSEQSIDTIKENTRLLEGKYPEKYNEMIVVLSDESQIVDLLLYSLGFRDNAELKTIITSVMAGEESTIENEPLTLTYEDIMNVDMRLINSFDLYKYNADYDIYEDMTSNKEWMNNTYDNAERLKIVGVAVSNGDSTTIGILYLPELTQHVIETAHKSEIVQKQIANQSIDVFSNTRFDEVKEETGLDFNDMVSVDENTLKDAFKMNIDFADVLSADKMKQASLDYGKVAAQNINTVAPMLMTSFETLEKETAKGLVDYYLQFSVKTKEVNCPEYLDDTDKSKGCKIPEGHEEEYEDSTGINLYIEKPYNCIYLKKFSKSMFFSMAGNTAIDKASEMTAQAMGDLGLTKEQLAVIIKPAVTEIFNTASAKVETLITSEISDSDLALEYSISDNTGKDSFIKDANAVLQSDTIKTANFKNAVENSSLLASAAIGEALGSVLKPLSDAGENIMTVDTDKFQEAFNFNMDEDELSRIMTSMLSKDDASYSNNLIKLGYQDKNDPTSISIYFKDFESKNNFIDWLDEYNEQRDEEDKIKYTDITGMLISSVETIVSSVTSVLIAFVSISLIVSSIMIAIITLISVMERTKEIGILRAMGASKKNVSSIFNAETFLIGLFSGLIGVGFTYLALIPINVILHGVNENITAVLNPEYAVILVLISVVLTLISGLIPASSAAKKDPVIALRTE